MKMASNFGTLDLRENQDSLYVLQRIEMKMNRETPWPLIWKLQSVSTESRHSRNVKSRKSIQSGRDYGVIPKIKTLSLDTIPEMEPIHFFGALLSRDKAFR